MWDDVVVGGRLRVKLVVSVHNEMMVMESIGCGF